MKGIIVIALIGLVMISGCTATTTNCIRVDNQEDVRHGTGKCLDRCCWYSPQNWTPLNEIEESDGEGKQ